MGAFFLLRNIIETKKSQLRDFFYFEKNNLIIHRD
jgi:hypothetical protein